jgi:methionyl aminopeptidase
VTGEPSEVMEAPEIKNHRQILGMRESCKLAANILKRVGNYVKVGLTTDDLDIFTHDLIINSGAYPSPLNYKNFPKSICTSVNNVACHGIPDDRALQDGDIINIDITVCNFNSVALQSSCGNSRFFTMDITVIVLKLF